MREKIFVSFYYFLPASEDLNKFILKILIDHLFCDCHLRWAVSILKDKIIDKTNK